jgi:hypothetical protein
MADMGEVLELESTISGTWKPEKHLSSKRIIVANSSLKHKKKLAALGATLYSSLPTEVSTKSLSSPTVVSSKKKRPTTELG